MPGLQIADEASRPKHEQGLQIADVVFTNFQGSTCNKCMRVVEDCQRILQITNRVPANPRRRAMEQVALLHILLMIANEIAKEVLIKLPKD